MQDYLDSISFEFGNKGSLFRTKFILEKLGLKDFSFDVVHVTGTNGKGSVCVKIAKGLSFGIKKVGLFLSPHIACFTERMQINSVPIDKAYAFKLLKKIRALAHRYKFELCFFDCMCILAFYYFHLSKVSIAVIEVGVGGSQDQTNFVSPILTIISSIGLDHQEMLGETIEKIAKQKAGILKDSVPVILGATSQLEPVLTEALRRKCDIISLLKQSSPDKENCLIARTALDFLRKKYGLNQEVFMGLKEKLPCRYELLNGRYLLDIAHNPIALLDLFKKIKSEFKGSVVHTIISMCAHKNLKESLQLVSENSDEVYIFHPNSKRLASREKMQTFLPKAHLFDSVFQALECTLDKPGLIVCCASAYFMKEVKEFLDLQKCDKAHDRLDMLNK